MRLAVALGATALLGVLGCGHKSLSAAEIGDAAPTAPTSNAPSVSPSAVALDMIKGFDACTLGHRGIVFDLGDPSSRARFGGRFEPAAVETLEREGSTWARIRARSLPVVFYGSADDVPHEAKAAGAVAEGPETMYVEARVRGLAAKTVTFYLDGKIMGATKLPKGEAGIVSVKSLLPALAEGQRELLLRFGGAPRTTSDAFAEVDWIHLGIGAPEADYAAPTRADVLTSVTLGGEPMRALSLRAPGFARCSGWIPKGSQVVATIAMVGAGEGDAQIRLLRDRVEPRVLGSVHLSPEEREPKRVSFAVGDLGGETGALGAVELVAASASKGARVLFGLPQVVASADSAPPPAVQAPPSAVRSAIVVVLGEVSTGSLSIYGGQRPVPELDALARGGITFGAQRATSPLSSAAFASLISGQSARATTLEDPSARLPRSVTTIGDAARQAGIAAALFTANPMTGSAFGFDRGWMTFEAASPNDDAPAVALFDHAAQWLDAHKTERFLLVVVARGGHPPWDATPEELKTMPPSGYTGALDAKHAGELLGRSRPGGGGMRWTDADRERAWALYALAVDAHDAALGRLMRALHAVGRDADTAVFVTGDVGVSEASHMPFADADSIDEGALWVPLVARLPSGALAGTRVSAPTSGVDVARTVLSTLGLEPPASFGGLNLFDVARGGSPQGGRPMAAVGSGRFAVRWDRYVLSGSRDRENKLCDLALEPSCVTDVRPTYPLALDILHRTAFDALVGGEPATPREPATLDATTSAALRAWGR